jgi:hypothetical protein
MSLKFLFASVIIVFSTQITGCSGITRSAALIKSLYSPAGTRSVTVGEIAVTTSPESGSDTTVDTLVVSADELGNAILSAGNGTLEMTQLVLNDKDRNHAIELLNILKKFGDTMSIEKDAMPTYVGAISSDIGLLNGSAIIGIDCISSLKSKSWMGKMNICYLDFMIIGSKKPIGSSHCDKEIDMYINPDSTKKLLSLLEKIPQSSSTIKNAKSKDDLSK